MRVDARQYYALAAAAPNISVKIGAVARERIGGLQGIAATPPAAQVTVVGHKWDTTCHDVRRFLARNQIVFDWLTPDAPELPALWPGPLPAEADCPVLRLADGKTLVRPQPRAFAGLLGLQTSARAAEYDVVIVGGGPVGLAAAVYGASEGLHTLVVEREAPGGQAGASSRIENYLGFPNGVSGDELAGRALRQAKRLGAEILVTRRIDPATRAVVLDGNETVRARTVILATGVTWRRPTIDGFDRLIGKCVYFGAARSEAASTLEPRSLETLGQLHPACRTTASMMRGHIRIGSAWPIPFQHDQFRTGDALRRVDARGQRHQRVRVAVNDQRGTVTFRRAVRRLPETRIATSRRAAPDGLNPRV